MSYLITCSGSKHIENGKPSLISNLSFPTLNSFRLNLIESSNIKLDWGNTLPAWKLYSGKRSKLYTKVSSENWLKECKEVKILSALFGWIDSNDYIPYYDLQMKDKINNIYVYNIWHSYSVLESFVNDSDIDLLTIPYRKAINGIGTPVAMIPNVAFADNYGTNKGIWLNSQLNDLKCVQTGK